MCTRKGKISRCPASIREQLNKKLEDGVPGIAIVEWLNDQPEVQAILQSEFDGHPINEPNLSAWVSGGFRDWQMQQEALELVGLMDNETDELNQVSKVRLIDLLAQRLAARYTVAARTLNRAEGDDAGELDLKRLHELCVDIVALQKGTHSAARLKLDEQQLALATKKFQHQTIEAIRKAATDPAVQAILAGAGNNDEKTEALGRAIFGEDWDA